MVANALNYRDRFGGVLSASAQRRQSPVCFGLEPELEDPSKFRRISKHTAIVLQVSSWMEDIHNHVVAR